MFNTRSARPLDTWAPSDFLYLVTQLVTARPFKNPFWERIIQINISLAVSTRRKNDSKEKSHFTWDEYIIRYARVIILSH